jgi:nitrogen-specific signal transduction histidine kinase
MDIEEIQQLSSWFVKDPARAGAVRRPVRTESTKLTPMTGRQVIKSVVTNVLGLTWHELVSRQVHVRVELDEDLPLVTLDPAEIQQDLLDLVVLCMDEMAQMRQEKRVMVIRAARDTPLERLAVTLSVQFSSTSDPASMMDRNCTRITVF